jgi:hypothetical protein
MRLSPYPVNWDTQSITGVTVGIKDTSANELLAATAATLYAGTTLGYSAEYGDSTISLAGGAANVSPGDDLQIASSADGPLENVRVKSYNSSTRVVTLDRDLLYAHASGAAVKGLFCTYALDTSTVATWTKGLQLVITWAPDTDDFALVERGEVALYSADYPHIKGVFQSRFHNEYDLIELDFDTFCEQGIKMVRRDMRKFNLEIDRLLDTENFEELYILAVRVLALQGQGDSTLYEYEVATTAYKAEIDRVTTEVNWQDTDQDGVQDAEEVDAHSAASMMIERSL